MPPKVKRIGIFGGSFDPPHLGHLIIAELAWRMLNLDFVLLVPAFEAPHKRGGHPSTALDRLQMAKLAVRGNKKLRVSDIEVRRKGVSYTVDTVKAIRRLFPSAELFLIIGSDSLGQFSSWKSPDAILREVTLAVYQRPRFRSRTARLSDSNVQWIRGPAVEISSSDIRTRIAHAKTIRYLVRENVLSFIKRKKLYLKTKA